MTHYKLDGKTPVPLPEKQLFEWAEWYSNANRVVKQEKVGPYEVSTVFLGLDHNHAQAGPPILFETMIFSESEAVDYQRRCSTWDQALAMHRRAVAWIKEHKS